MEDSPTDPERLIALIILARSSERSWLRAALGDGFEIIEADSGEHGLVLAVERRPACILVDDQLPDMNALEFLAARATRVDDDAILIVLTEADADGNPRALPCLDHGARDLLIRGEFGAFTLQRTLANHLEKVALRREAAAARQAVHASEARLQLLIEHAPASLAILDRDLHHLAVSQRWCSDFGFAPSELIGRAHYEVFPEIPPSWREVHRRALAGETLSATEDCFERTDGSRQWVHWEVCPWRDIAGEVAGIAIFSEDITARKQAEDDLRDSEERLRLLADNLPNSGLYQYARELDGSVRFLFVSAGIARLSGVPTEQILANANALHRLLPPDKLEQLFQATERSARELSDFDAEVPLRRPDGETRWMRLHARPRRQQDGRVIWDGVQTDITEHKQAELALRRYQQVIDNSHEMLFLVDHELRFQLANPAYTRVRATTPEAIRGQAMSAVIDPDAYAWIEPEIRATLAGESRHIQFQTSFSDGVWRHMNASSAPFHVGENILGAIVTMHDVTELEQARAALERERDQLEQRVAERTADLRRSEAKLRGILELLPVGILITDPDGRIIDCNTAAETILQLPRDVQLPRQIDQPAWPGIRPDGSPMPTTEYASVRAMVEQRAVLNVELGLRQPEYVRWLLTSAMPSEDPDHGLIIVYVDITERKAAEAALQASETRARAIIDASPVPFSINEPPESITYLNPAFTRLFGYTRADIPTLSHWWPLAYPDPNYRRWVLDSWQSRLEASQRNGEPFVPLEISIQAKSGARVTALASATPLGAPEAGIYLVSLFDVTELREAREQAEQAAHAKARFLAHMSHEIRTPLNGLLGLSELALLESLSPAVRDYVDQIHQSGRVLVAILNDILDHSKIEAGQMTLELARFNLDELLHQLQGLFQGSADAKGIALSLHATTEAPRLLVGDALRLRQILTNLLSNAVKFTEAGRIRVEVNLLEQTATTATLLWRIADTGIGIDAAAQARLFAPFTQGDESIARRYGGTGLGLSISHQLVGLMGGELTVTSAPGEGSVFSFAIPLKRALDSPPPSAAATALTIPASKRILVAEDHPVNQFIIKKMLHQLELDITLVADGEAALRELSNGHFDLVLMDIQMPGMDGLSATRNIRKNPDWTHLPVIALTAGITPEERANIADAGLNDLLPKPVTLDALRAILAHWLKLS